MSVKTYSKKTDGNKQLSANFQVLEFACKGTDTILIDEELVTLCQKGRDHFGVQIDINSGYRSTAHNKSVGGSPNSQHLYGKAADIKVHGVKPTEVVKFYEALGVKGIGLYNGHTHIDTRSTKSFWDARSGSIKSTNTFGGSAPAAPATSAAPAKKSIDVLAKEVIDGKWGNGTDRKNRLIAAGYDYSTVQKEVDKLVAATKKTPKVGDIVTFSGGSHYSASNSTKATGSKRTAGTAKITAISTGAKHPYHLVGVKSNVYGWVDANLIK